QPRIVTIVCAVDEERFTSPTSASVPVLTDHRSTPHCARIGDGSETNDRMKRRGPANLRMISVLQTTSVVGSVWGLRGVELSNGPATNSGIRKMGCSLGNRKKRAPGSRVSS